jgi:hypothetical protein
MEGGALNRRRPASYEFKMAVNDDVSPEPDEPVTVNAW